MPADHVLSGMVQNTRRRRAASGWRWAVLGLALLAAACASPPAPGASRSPAELSPAELKYIILAQVGPIWYCDPDLYPVGRPISPAYLDARLAEIQKDAETYQAILRHNQLQGTDLTASQKLLVYQDYKRLRALDLEPTDERSHGQGYRFKYVVGAAEGGKQGTAVEGTIDSSGSIHVSSRTPGAFVSCPICLAAETRIDTPRGALPVTQLRPGMAVWTLDAAGRRTAAVIEKVGHVETSNWHEVVHIVLGDGRELRLSPGHPTADGRVVGDLVVGDILDAGRIVAAERVPYGGAATYDVLPSGGTGAYWANGILLGSTLR